MGGHNRVAIFWDYENCRSAPNITGYTLVDNIRRIACEYGIITLFKAYLEISEVSAKASSFRSELQCSGVSLTDCPHNGRKDVADKMIMVDMLAYAIDNPTPATIILISGDRDFAYTLSTLRLRQYHVVLIVPPGSTHSSLKSQASEIFEWNADVLNRDDGDIPRTTRRLSTTSESGPSAQPPPREPNKDAVHRTSFSGSSSSHPLQTTSHAAERNHHKRIQSWFDTLSGTGQPAEAVILDTTSKTETETEASESTVLGITPACVSSETTGGSFALTFDHSDVLDAEELEPIGIQPSSFPETSVPTVAATSDITLATRYDAFNFSGGVNRLSKSEPSSPLFGFEEVRLESPLPGSNTGSPESSDSSLEPSSLSSTTLSQISSTTKPPHSIDYPPLPPPSTSISSTDGSSLGSPSVPLTEESTLPLVPDLFKALVEYLDRLRSKGLHQPTRFVVSMRLAGQGVFERAGVSEFNEYILLAEEAGVIQTGGQGAKAWVALHPKWHGYGQMSPVLVSTQLSAGTTCTGNINHTQQTATNDTASTEPIHPPPEFQLLVNRLERLRTKDFPRPLRPVVDVDLLSQDQWVYKRAGAATFEKYLEMAVKAEIIQTGGEGPRSWVTLNSKWHGYKKPLVVSALFMGGTNPSGVTSSPSMAKERAVPTNSLSPSSPPFVPSDVQHTTSGASSQKANSLEIPAMYRTLANLLETHRRNGFPRPTRVVISAELLQKDKTVFKVAGVSKFKQYLTLAQAAGIVVLGGKDADAWVSLHPQWHGNI